MKKIYFLNIVCLAILLLTGCEKDNSDQSETKLYRLVINISNERITDYTYYIRDSAYYRTEYSFDYNTAKKTTTSLGENSVTTTIYTLGANGFAASSIEIPEHYYLENGDTVYSNRIHYTYDEENHLTGKSYEVIHGNEVILIKYVEYSYENGNLYIEKPCGPATSSPGMSDCFTLYTHSEIPSILDIDNFSNGILGVTSRLLVSKVDYLVGCPCIINVTPGTAEISYELDSLGYVVKKTKVSEYCSRYEEENPPSVKVTYYEIHLND